MGGAWIGAGASPSLDYVDWVGSLLRVYFDEAMTNNALLQSASSYTITPLAGGVSVSVIAATPGLGSPNYVDLTLNHYLTDGSLYELSVNPLLVDVAGNPMDPLGTTLQFLGVAPGTVTGVTLDGASVLERRGDTAASFINGLSDLWLRFFEDKNQLEAMYKGTEALIGQVYLDLLDTVLNLSLSETPLYNREYYKLVTVREDQVTYVPSINRYVFNMPDSIKDFQFLFNKVLSPTAVLQKGIDFEIDFSDEEDELRFKRNIFDWSGAGDVVPGFANRVVEVSSGGSIVSYREVAFWIPDVHRDYYNLFTVYGHLITSFSPSSEAYRALLQGISRYFILGPTLEHILSALNVCSGFGVVRDDGEVLQLVDTTDLLVNTVETDRRSYVFDKNVPLREDILDASNWGVTTFRAYETLTAVYAVNDYISNPSWWHNAIIPEELTLDPLTGLPEILSRRSSNPYLSTPVFGGDDLRFGDIGFFFGCDDDGFDPAAAGLARSPLRHNFAYLVFEYLLKYHLFVVSIHPDVISDPTFAFPIWDSQIVEIVLAGKPAYVYLYTAPTAYFEDQMTAQDTLEILPGVDLTDHFSGVHNALVFGVRSAQFGDYYTLSPTGVNVFNESVHGAPDRTLGENPFCFGGVDPTHRVLPLASDNAGANKATLSLDYDNHEVTVTVATPAFHATDVGCYFEDMTNGVLAQISAVLSSVSIRIAVWYAYTLPVSWYVWSDHPGIGPDRHSDGGVTDWPLSITVGPP